MTESTVTGDKELDRLLQQLGGDIVAKISQKSLGKGLTVLVRAMRKEVPAVITPGSKRKTITDAIGRKNRRYKRGNLHFAKAGAGVGGASKKPGANLLHLLILGTDERYVGFSSRERGNRGSFVRTKNAIGYRGRIKPNDFIKRGLAGGDQEALERIRKAFYEELDKEVAKLPGGR